MEQQNWLETLLRSLNVELPPLDTLDEYLAEIIPLVRKWGEDLGETQFYSVPGGKPWLEVRDEENFHNAVLHFFNEDGEYLRSVDGNVIKGRWRLLEGTNKIIIEVGSDRGGVSELYELAYLDTYFFILRKHGGPPGRKKYFAMGYEPYIQGLEWRDYTEALFNTYRSKHRIYQYTMAAIVLFVLIILFFSFIY